jgi:hypothetical protein
LRYLTVLGGVRESVDAREKEMSPKLAIFLGIALLGLQLRAAGLSQ